MRFNGVRPFVFVLLAAVAGCADTPEPNASAQTGATVAAVASSAPASGSAYAAYVAEATAPPRLIESDLRKKAQALRTKLSDDTAVAWSRDLQQNLRTQRKRLPDAAPGAVYAAALADVHKNIVALRATSAQYKTFARGRATPAVPVSPLPTALDWTPYTAAPSKPATLPERWLTAASSANADPAGDAELKTCVRRARMNLDQCLAAAKGAHETAYCVASHGIDEPSNQCFGWLLP